MKGIMAAESSGLSTNPYESDDNDDLFLPQSSSSSSGLIHLQIPNSNHGAYDTHLADENDKRDYMNSGYQEKMTSVQLDSHLRRQESMSPPDTPESLLSGRLRQGSIVDGLLHEIYDRWHFGRHDSFDSDTLTECSSTSECLWSGRNEFFGNFEGGYHSSVRRQTGSLSRSFLQNQTVGQLERLLADVQRSVAVMSARLVRQLKRRDRRIAKLGRNCDVVTAILQAASLKRQIDTRMRFSIQPPPGESAFDQWRDAMKAVARLPMGIPPEFRKKVWLSLADHYLVQLRINWEKTVRFVFNERSNPDDDKLGVQIVKDLHRTGCSNFSGDDNEEDRAILKRVLLAYARWNKRVGYCQGFNVIAALLLNVMDRKEDDALKVMIYLIDSVLPESYFANNLRALSVDMAVFRDLLGLTYQRLSKHLDRLQLAAQDVRTGACYEPPLTNVFTMQWFLTLFATCLPVDIVLRVWDSVLLEGSEILLRTGLTIWGRLSKRIMTAHSADEFYSLMGELSTSIMQGAILDGDTMVKSIYALGEFPLPHINELREKYTYNIRPFTPSGTSGKKGSSTRSVIKSMLGSDDDELDDDDIAAMACMPGEMNGSSSDISVLGPGVYGSGSDPTIVKGTMQMERMSTDISNLKLQYQRLKQRQQQAHIIIAAASAKKTQPASSSASKNSRQRQRIATMSSAALLPNIESPTAMNHLFVGKAGKLPSSGKNRLVTEGPRISELPTARKSGLLAKQLQAVAKAQAVSKSQRMRSGGMRTAEATSNTSVVQSPLATQAAPTSSLNLEIEQSNLSPPVATEKNHQDRAASTSPLSEQCEKNSEQSLGSNQELSGNDVLNASCLGQELEIRHSEIQQEGQTAGDHKSLSQSDELISSNCDEPKQIPENHSESYKTDFLDSHSVPSDILRNESTVNSELSSDSTLEENVDTASVCSDLPLVNIDSSSDKTSPEAVIKNFDVSCFTGSTSDPQQEDSGVESSSTTSPSITPGKRLCQEEHLSSSEAVHETEDEDLILSVETAFAPEDTERTISVSHIENTKVEFEYEIEGNSQRHDMCPQSRTVNESGKMPQLCECEDNDVKDHSKEVALSNEFGNVDPHVQTQNPTSDGKELIYDDPQKHSNSFDHSEDVNTLLGMVATSPQRKYIRSMSVPKSTYTPSPSLIETVSVPETLDVEEELNAKAVSKRVLREVKSLDQNGTSSHRKQTSEYMKAARKNKSSSKESITKEKRKEVNEVRNESRTRLQDASQTNKSRLSSPSLSFPLSPEVTGHQEPAATAKHSPSKPFNPFPIKLFNANRAKTGLKLGLYTASTLQQLKGVKGRTSST